MPEQKRKFKSKAHLGARRPVNVQPRCHLHAEPIQGKHLVQSFAVHREDHTILESDG